MGAFFYMQAQWGPALATEKLGWLPLLSLVVFFIAYSGGYSNVPFILMGELFPSRYRSILGPLSSSFNLCCTFIVVRSFPIMQISMEKYGAFWFFMCCTLLGIVFVYFLLPETLFQQIQRRWYVEDTGSAAGQLLGWENGVHWFVWNSNETKSFVSPSAEKQPQRQCCFGKRGWDHDIGCKSNHRFRR
jgi:hypothetical protein